MCSPALGIVLSAQFILCNECNKTFQLYGHHFATFTLVLAVLLFQIDKRNLLMPDKYRQLPLVRLIPSYQVNQVNQPHPERVEKAFLKTEQICVLVTR